MNSFSFTVLGSTAAIPTIGKHQSSHIVNMCEQLYLIDCGEGVQEQLKRCKFSLQKINHIFISHLHGDHFYGIYGVISTLSLLGRKTPLYIYAPAPLREAIESHRRLFEPKMGYEVICKETNTLEPELIYENKVMEVWSVPLKHKIPTTGYYFKEKTPRRNIRESIIEQYKLDYLQINALKDGKDIIADSGEVVASDKSTYLPYSPRSFAYMSDTSPSKEAANFIKGVDLLYHEATFLNEDKKIAIVTGHSTPKDAAFIASLSNAKKLLLGHFSLRYKGGIELFEQESKEHFTNVEAVIEGTTYKL